MKKKFENKTIAGQSMVMMVVMLSTAALGAASLATFLILSGFRNISNAGQSMDAIFAADSGIECVLFREFGHVDYSEAVTAGVCPSYSPDSSNRNWPGPFYFVSNKSNDPRTLDWSSFGEAGLTKRVLNIRFNKRGT